MADVSYSCPACRHSFRVNETKRLQVCCPECGRQLEWFFHQGTQKRGPVSGTVIQQMLKRDELCDSDQVMQEGSTSWIVVSMLKTALNTPKPVPRAILVETKSPNPGQDISNPQPIANTWYYARDGKKCGPLSTEQLRQLAVTDQLHPQDLVLKLGTRQWVEARNIPELKFEHERKRSPLVPCEKCRGRISDIAETCPKCGHPQPKLQETPFALWWHKEANCKNCGTHNIIDFSLARIPNQVQRCRGCMRILKETNEGDYLQHDMDRVYRNSIERSRKGRNLYDFLSIVSFLILARLVPSNSVYLKAMIGLAGAICVHLLCEYFVRRYIQWTGAMTGLSGEVSQYASNISSGDALVHFSKAAKNYEEFKQAEKKLGHPDYQAKLPCSWFVIWAVIIAIVISGFYLYYNYCDQYALGQSAGAAYVRECNENGTLNDVDAHQLPSNSKKSAGWKEGFRNGVMVERARIYAEKTKQ